MQSVLKSNISILNIISCLIVFPKQSSVLILSGPVGIRISCRKNRLDWGASLGESVYIGRHHKDPSLLVAARAKHRPNAAPYRQ